MKLHINILKIVVLLLFFSSFLEEVKAQQDPQYTQYMYNTMSVNPAYAGTREVFSVTGLHRSQWVGLTGAPQTQTLGIETPIGLSSGLGLNIVNDKLGPVQETYFDANYSYTIPTGFETSLSFGLKAGGHLLNVDFSKGTASQQNDPNLVDIKSRFLPAVGAGVYWHHDTKWYVGLSSPNLLSSKHYDEDELALAEERFHMFLIAGYVFDLNENVKFKPAVLGKAVSGAPISVDVSANFLINDKITLGVGYRWEDAVSALAGIQIIEKLFVGYAYDYTTTNINDVSHGSHEIMLRFDVLKSSKRGIKSPRFF